MTDTTAAEPAANNDDTEKLTPEQEHSQLVGRLLNGQSPEVSE
ncbi:MAG TPA: hypothetical protein VG816_13755 [Solirubrobacterales bacterium]|nr:hypothetical protein [Solirubrobacterales bacterium]